MKQLTKLKYVSYQLSEYFYGVDEDNKKQIIYPFRVTPMESKESTDSILSIVIDNKDIDIKPSDVISLKDFKKKVGTIGLKYTKWYGKEDDFKIFMNMVLDIKVKTTEYLKTSGFYFKNNEWIFACNGGVIDKNNQIDDKYSTNKENNDSFCNSKLISELEILEIKDSLLSYNDKGIVTSHIGYAASLFLRERLYRELKVKSPCLTNFGNPGSGKTMSLDKVILPLLNMSVESKLSAKSLTPFSFLSKLCDSNFFPVVVDDLKKSIMTGNRVDLIIGKINESYDRPTIERGKADQTINKYEIKASTILSGETNTLDTSNNDRIINSVLSKKSSLNHENSFLDLCKKEDILRKIGKSLLIESMNISKDSLLELLESNLEFIKNNSSKLTSRMILSLAITSLGFDFIEIVIGKIENKDCFKLEMINNFMESTLDEEGESKDTTSIILEEINKLAYLEIIKGDFKIVNSKKYNKQSLAIDLNLVFDKLDKYNKDAGKTTRLQYSAFTSLAKKESYYLGYELVSLSGSKRRCYFFDIKELESMNLDLDSLGIHNSEYSERESIETENKVENLIDYKNKKEVK
jgi:hypothetical protein